MHEKANSMWVKLPGGVSHALSRSPGCQPAAATTQSPARTVRWMARSTSPWPIGSPARGARSASRSARQRPTASPTVWA